MAYFVHILFTNVLIDTFNRMDYLKWEWNILFYVQFMSI